MTLSRLIGREGRPYNVKKIKLTIPRWWPWFFARSSVAIALISLRGLVAPAVMGMPNLALFLQDAPWALPGHIVAAPTVPAPVQVSRAQRARWPRAHRIWGRLYGIRVLIAGRSALVLVPMAGASLFAKAGFTALALAWIGPPDGASGWPGRVTMTPIAAGCCAHGR